jgi:hypothetical protein
MSAHHVVFAASVVQAKGQGRRSGNQRILFLAQAQIEATNGRTSPYPCSAWEYVLPGTVLEAWPFPDVSGSGPGRIQATNNQRGSPMRKSLFAVAALAALGAIGIAAPASAAPGMIGAADAATSIVDVRMDGMHGHRGHGRMMGHRRGHGHMMRHHGHHRGHMMRHGHRHHRM